MSRHETFKEVKARYYPTLIQYVPVVARVHGNHHPEFYEVQEVFASMIKKSKETEEENTDLFDEFSSLRAITNHYLVPDDVCESYEAVYNMLAALDQAYHS